MKKMMSFFIAIFVVCQFTVNAQPLSEKMTDQEIMKLIWSNAPRNPQIDNPDQIFPGQNLTIGFPDGFDTTYTVVDGDTQWSVVQKLREPLNRLSQNHGEVAKVQYGGVIVYNTTDWDLFALVILIALCAIVIAIYLGYRKAWNSKNAELDAVRAQQRAEEETRTLRDRNVLNTGELESQRRAAKKLVEENVSLRESVENQQWQQWAAMQTDEASAFVLPQQIPTQNTNPELVASTLRTAAQRALPQNNVVRVENPIHGLISGNMEVIFASGKTEKVSFQEGEAAWKADLTLNLEGEEITFPAYWRASCLNFFRSAEGDIASVNTENIRFIETANPIRLEPVDLRVQSNLVDQNLPKLAERSAAVIAPLQGYTVRIEGGKAIITRNGVSAAVHLPAAENVPAANENKEKK